MEQVRQVLAVTIVLERGCQLFQFFRIDPALPEGDLFEARDLKSLTLFSLYYFSPFFNHLRD